MADPLEVAAALAFLVQKTRPLKPVVHSSERKAAKPRSEQGERRPARQESRSAPRPARHEPEEGMKTYRVEVGADHNVEPKHLVGAIANEAGLESQYIGRISIMDDHSYVDLPDGMPRDIFQHLRKVWVNQQQLQISLPDSVEEGRSARPKRKMPKKAGPRKDFSNGKPKKRHNKRRG